MRIVAEQGDITRVQVDAIVNAANSRLLGGGGVDGAIHAAAGPRLLEACRRLRKTTHRDGLEVGDAVATEGFDLPARWVIHTVGPNRNRGQVDPPQLESCFTRSLDVAAELGARSVAFPAVSAGAYGWAAADVARIAVDAVRSWQPPDSAGRPGVPGDDVRYEVRDDGARPGAPDDAHRTIEEVRFVLFAPALLHEFEVTLA